MTNPNLSEEEKYQQLLQKQPVIANEEEEDLLSALDLPKIIAIFKKTWLWLLLIPILCIFAAYMTLRYTKALFLATSSIKMEEKENTSGNGMLGAMLSTAPPEANLVGELEIIKSPLLYEEVIKALDLSVQYFIEGTVLDQEIFPATNIKIIHKIKNESLYGVKFYIKPINKEQYEISYTIAEKTTKVNGILQKTLSTSDFDLNIMAGAILGTNNYFIINNKYAVFNYLDKNLDAQILNPTAKVIGVNFKDHNAVKARDIVRLVDSMHQKKTIEIKSRAIKQQRDYLNTYLKSLEDTLTKLESQMNAYILSNRTSNAEAKLGENLTKIKALTESRSLLTTKIDDLIGAQGLVNSVKPTDKKYFVAPAGIDGSISAAIMRLNEIKLQQEQIGLSALNTTLEYQRVQEALNSSKMLTNQMIDNANVQLRKQINRLDIEIGRLEGELGSLPSQNTELSKIRKKYALYEGYFTDAQKKKVELDLKEAGTVAGFDIIAPAVTPTVPISPKKTLFYGVAAGVGIFLSLALVLLQYILHNTITSQKDLEKLTHLPILGAVPRYKKEKLVYSQLLVHLNPKSSMSEAFRSIRTNLDFMFPKSRTDKSRFSQKVISVTSNISGEGKTFVTANLGGIIAYSGLKVVILDLDMRKPKIHFAFKTNNDKGVSTILIGKHTIEECIKKTEIPNLDFITAGALPPNPSELILTDDFVTLLADLKKIYDVVLLDTPPVGLVTDGFLIMQNTDARLFVLRADYSKKVFAKNINRIVQNNKIAHVGLILNSVDNNGGAYGYGYGYGYGGYYEDNNIKEPTIWERIKLFFKTNFVDRFSK